MNVSVAESFCVATETCAFVHLQSFFIVPFSLSCEDPPDAKCCGRRLSPSSRWVVEDFGPRARTSPPPPPTFPASLADAGAGAECWGLEGPSAGRGGGEWGAPRGGRCSHTGQVGVVLGPVLQGGQLGHLLQLLLAGPTGWHAAEQALQVVGQDLRGRMPMRGCSRPALTLSSEEDVNTRDFNSSAPARFWAGVASYPPGLWGTLRGM